MTNYKLKHDGKPRGLYQLLLFHFLCCLLINFNQIQKVANMFHFSHFHINIIILMSLLFNLTSYKYYVHLIIMLAQFKDLSLFH